MSSSKKENNPAPESRSLEQEITKGFNASPQEIDKKESDKVTTLPVTNKVVLRALQENMDGDAFLLIKLLKDRYTYDHATKDWYYWNDHFWRLDKVNHIMTLIKEVIDLYGTQKIYEMFCLKKAKSDGDEEAEKSHKYLVKMLTERINGLRTLKRKKEVLAIACNGLRSLGVTGEKWDMNPMLLGCRNCCINLGEGIAEPGDPHDYIKMVSPIEWKSWDTPCINWRQFLSQMFNNDQEVVNYIQRLFGYAITGLNTEHIFPIFWGPEGRNGKGTLFETLKFVLGDFAYKVPSNFFIEQTIRGGTTAPDAVMGNFFGKRLAWGSETNERDRLNVAKLKEMVGGDTITARLPYAKRPVEFSPTHLLVIITNMRPKVPANDMALWRRIHLIPLVNSFVDVPNPAKPHEFKADKMLLSRLKQEASGILAWLVEGCMLWQRDGLNPPKSINDATNEYRANEDIIGDYIKECCYEREAKSLKIEVKEFYNSYKNWCEDVGHRPMAKKRFFDDIKTRFQSHRSNGKRYYINVGLKD